MYIDKNVEPYVVNENVNITDALKKLSASQKRIIFTVDNYFRLTGAISDGDFRRWVLEQENLSLDVAAKEVANADIMSANDEDDSRAVADKLSNKVQFLPVLDKEQRIVGVASFKQQGIVIGRHSLNEESAVFTIAEIGNNHNGSLELAKELVDLAADSGADCAKFQMRDLDSLYSNAGDANDDAEDLGSQYVLDLLSRFQLSDEAFKEIFDYCRTKELAVLCTPFDSVSADKLAAYGVEAYKVASADLTNHDLLNYIASKGRPMIVSTGMATEQEICDAVELLRKAAANYVLLHCNSTYPAPFKDINLNYMSRLKEIGECLVGYSGHERGINIPIAAAALGAKVIEKHFTVDRRMEGNDHKVSLLPQEFKKMVEGIRQIEEGMGTTRPRTLSQGELMNRETLAKSVIAKVDIPEGVPIEESMLEIKSPGKGLAPYRKADLFGKKSPRSLSAGDFFYTSDLSVSKVLPRDYDFKLPFGIPVRYHDLKTLATKSNFDMLEFHLSYKDMDVELERYLDQPYDIGFAVHAPELFTGDHTLDLCSKDEAYRARSIKELQRVIDVTRALKKYFPKTDRPVIVCNVGGFTSAGFMTEEERKACYVLLKESLAKLDPEGVELIPQTMPPFPWHFGGQQYHNLFVSADDIVEFCSENNMRICFDISHTMLACNYYDWDLNDFVSRVAEFSAHLHIADSSGSDGEGLQIGDGDIDFTRLKAQLRECCPEATWIPEIWQGHKNDGEGFWVALERLEG
jgi:sialic acid synthase SpsE/sugar phosphate isomerase/epimerase